MARRAGPILSIAAALLLAAATSGAAGCSRPDPPPPPPPPTPEKVELDLVTTALHECLTLDCERAFAHVSELPKASPLRQSDAFRAILYRYYADQLLHADREPDLEKRRLLYGAVFAAPDVDGMLKLAASERMARLGVQAAAAQEVALNTTASAKLEAAAAAAALLAKSRSKVPADQKEVRAELEPKIFSGKATPEDVAMLRTVCKAQRDTACLRQLDRLILR